MRPTACAEGGVSGDTVASQPTMGDGGSGEGAQREDADLSPRARRKRSHKAVEVERRQRISRQLDRLKSILGCPAVNEASALTEAVLQLNLLNERCNMLEFELVHTEAQRSQEGVSEGQVASTSEGDSDDREANAPAPAEKEGPVRITRRCSRSPAPS